MVRPKGRQRKEDSRNLRFLGGCGQSPPWLCSLVEGGRADGLFRRNGAEKCANAFVRNPSPPESRKRQGRNTPIFQLCRAEPVGRAANFRANFHGAAAKLNALQAFNAPTCHGNSRNTSFNVLPRRVPIHAEPSAVPHTRRTPRFSSLRGEKARKQPERQLQRSSSHRSNPSITSAAPHTRRTPRFSSLRGEKRKNSRNASFNVLPHIVPIRAEPLSLPHTRRTPRFSALRGEKARTQPERSTFSPASFQSTQNHPPLPATALSDLP